LELEGGKNRKKAGGIGNTSKKRRRLKGVEGVEKKRR